MRFCCLFGYSMENSAFCDVLIDQEMLNYVVWFIVKVRMLAAGHNNKLCYCVRTSSEIIYKPNSYSVYHLFSTHNVLVCLL